MDKDSIERFHRLVRSGDDELIITPPKGLLDEIERMGQDPRRPRTAIARWASRIWLEHSHESMSEGTGVELDASHSEKELMYRPAHYPVDWGLDMIPFPSDLSGVWLRDRNTTLGYTSLTTPRPFDPQLHGDVKTGALGFGYNYQGSTGFPDQQDIITRRGGGPRGGFSMTTGPTEGAYPTAILPQPVFNLGRLGFSDGGWNPEGLQWTNRPKRMRLGGLRNGWAHKIFFARSRRVLFRNLYGPLARDEATPQSPTVVINGLNDLHGITSVNLTQNFNGPTEVNIELNNPSGRRTGWIKRGDTVQVYASPRTWASPPLVFTGFVSEVHESSSDISFKCLCALGYLNLEVVKGSMTYFQTDAATVIKDIVANSTYAPPVGRMANQSHVVLPAGMNFVGQTRLSAIQTILNIINSTPALNQIYCSADGYINFRKLREVDDATVQPFIAGRMPRSALPQDFYPTGIERESGEITGFNVAIVSNPELDINVSVPATDSTRYPSIPVEKRIEDDSITDEVQAKLVGEYFLNTQGLQRTKWVVNGIPERFDLRVGDVMEFASNEASLSGRHRIFNITWGMSPSGSTMTLTVGRQGQDLMSTLKFTLGISQ